MNVYSIEVIADGRPIGIHPTATVEASSHGTAVARGYRMAKKSIRRGAVRVTVSATRIPKPKPTDSRQLTIE